MNDDELRFVATSRHRHFSEFYFDFDSVDSVVDKIVEWENIKTKSRAGVFFLENWQSFYVDIIEKLVARNRTENIACSSSTLEGTLIRIDHDLREALLRRLKQQPNEKIKFRGNTSGDEAKIACGGLVHKRVMCCDKYCFKVYSPASGKRGVNFMFRLSEKAHDPYWPPEIVCLDQFVVDECCVCFESCERAPRLECGHSLCRSCFDSWKRVRSTCPLCRSSLRELPFDIVGAFNAAVAARPVGELWYVEHDVGRLVGVSPWRWKDFRYLRQKPSRLFMDVDCILTTDVDRSRYQLRRLVRIKRKKFLFFPKV
jgi:hypothetical protein